MLFKLCLYLERSCIPNEYFRVRMVTTRNKQTFIVHKSQRAQTWSMVLGMFYLFTILIIEHQRTVLASHNYNIVSDWSSTKNNFGRLRGDASDHLKLDICLRWWSRKRVEWILLHHIIVTNPHVLIDRLRFGFSGSLVQCEINTIFLILERLWVLLIFFLKVRLLLFLKTGIVEDLFFFHEKVFWLPKVWIFLLQQIMTRKSDVLDKRNCWLFELLGNEKAVLILSEDQKLLSDFLDREKFFPLQIGDILHDVVFFKFFMTCLYRIDGVFIAYVGVASISFWIS